jgi:hypothetical protein
LSHTLYFYRRPGRPEDSSDRIPELLDTLPHTSRAGEADDLHYEYRNPTTGAEFVLEYRRPGLGIDQEIPAGHYPGFEPAGLTARVDYLRPSYFGMECLPWIAHVASTLDLGILDAQSDGGSTSGPADEIDVAALVACWDRCNTHATHSLRSQEGIEMAYAPRAVLETWWRYTMVVPELREHYGERVEVLAPRLMQDRRGRVTPLATWSFPRAAVLPPGTGLLFLERERRRLKLLTVQERGTVRADTLMAAASSGLERRSDPHPHVLFDPDRLTEDDRRAVERMPIDTRTQFAPVNPTRLTDVEWEKG